MSDNAQMTTTAGTAMIVPAAGQAANHFAGQGVFAEYANESAGNTRTTRLAALKQWATYLVKTKSVPVMESPSAGVFVTDPATWDEAMWEFVERVAADLANTPAAWLNTTWGLVDGFKQWLLDAGYSVATVNNRLTAVRVYAALAVKAGVLDKTEAHMIATVKGMGRKTGVNVDSNRPTQRREASKKAAHVAITIDQAHALMAQPQDTAQGRRDAVMMTLLLDHGLRVGELARVQVAQVDLTAGELRFYRPKSKLYTTLELTKRTRRALAAYLEHDAPAMGPLLRAIRKDGVLGEPGLSERAIQARIRTLGAAVGVKGLSPHDCRHYAATLYARKGVGELRLMEMFGWNSSIMARRYVEESRIANEGTAHLVDGGDD